MSDQVPERKKPGPKPKTHSLPRVSVLDRRLRNPFGAPSQPIGLLTEGDWEIRWVSSTMRAGRLYDMTRNKGWAFIAASELDGTPDEYGLKVVNDRLVRGDHGEEVLMKMPRAMYRQIQQAKAEHNTKGLGKQAMRESVAQTTAKELGSQAGDAAYNAFQHGDVIDTKGPDQELETEEA